MREMGQPALLNVDSGVVLVGASGTGYVRVCIVRLCYYLELDSCTARGDLRVGCGPSRHSVAIGVFATGNRICDGGGGVGKRDGPNVRVDITSATDRYTHLFFSW